MLRNIAIINIAVSVLLMLWAILDVNRRPPPMTVMKWVWPLTFLWGGVFALIMYLWFGRSPKQEVPGEYRYEHGERPFWQSVALGATHCGAGCSLADILVETGMFTLGLGFVVLGQEVFGNWIVEYVVALIIGVVFQYGAQAPMSDASWGTIWWQSFKSDVLSLTFWQVGMYGWMAISIFVLFGHTAMKPDHWIFWWMMQFAMLSGFFTTYPINWILIRKGIKEAM
ncbi:DUF4396 domain-containing protein [Nitrosococcus watsonii]|uniref:Putative integral membrane protein n=1 Tax=Nitrosococcus watsoni (strain C-113) TaxID=105559 RepID=D8K871_NITWC|nr:DUF4396 domain-containing protein [Nitrosococcus watsonii]ADJ27066.1 putative integral membrane protein [Nitrosococcus watsonii C-113]